ncbi:MAG: IS110 family transposase [Cyanobacteria bacterium P01_F01_bin.4]
MGIDVHKKTYTVEARVNQERVKRWTTSADPERLRDQLKKYFAGAEIHSVYEAGFSGFVLHRVLVSGGIDNIVVNPGSVETAAHDRVKTDKRDAHKLGEQLEGGRLKGIHIPSEAQEQGRFLSRTRAQLVKECTAVKNKIRMKAHQLGLIAAEDTRSMSHGFVEALLSASPSAEFTLVVEALWAVWRTLEAQVKRLESALADQAKADAKETIYRSVPGIGAVSARVLSNELGDMSQFTNERQLFSYTGLTPSEHSSGPHTHRGPITHQGNRYLRGILIEAAWRALSDDPALARFFERLLPRTGAKRAIVAVARKLIGRIRAALRKGELYQRDYEITVCAGG